MYTWDKYLGTYPRYSSYKWKAISHSYTCDTLVILAYFIYLSLQPLNLSVSQQNNINNNDSSSSIIIMEKAAVDEQGLVIPVS